MGGFRAGGCIAAGHCHAGSCGGTCGGTNAGLGHGLDFGDLDHSVGVTFCGFDGLQGQKDFAVEGGKVSLELF